MGVMYHAWLLNTCFSSCSKVCACKLNVVWTIALINQMFSNLCSIVQSRELLYSLALFIASFLIKVPIENMCAQYDIGLRVSLQVLRKKSCLVSNLCLAMVCVSTLIYWRCVLRMVWYFIETDSMFSLICNL